MPPRDISRRFFARPIGRSPFAPPPFRVPRWVYLVVAGDETVVDRFSRRFPKQAKIIEPGQRRRATSA